MHVTETELKTRLDRYLDAAQAEPVIVEKFGRASSVVLSKRRYDQLCELEDKLWQSKRTPQSKKASCPTKRFASY